MTAPSLAGFVVVVTGASSGIGHATAIAFARDGAHVVLAARGRAALDTVADECRECGGEALVVETDVGDSSAVAALAEAAAQRFGRIAALSLTTAGIAAWLSWKHGWTPSRLRR